MEITIDKYYQDMIDNILNGASDREQLEIILKLVEGLKGWNDKGNDYLTNLYYYNLEQIAQKIKVVLEKEDCYSSYNKAIRDYGELKEIFDKYTELKQDNRSDYDTLCYLIRTDKLKRFSITNDLVKDNMIDFWFKDILLTIKKKDNSYDLFGIEVYDYNGNLVNTFDNIEELKKEVEVLDNEREINY